MTDKELIEMTRYKKPCPDPPRGQRCPLCEQSYVCLHPDRKKEDATEDIKPLPEDRK